MMREFFQTPGEFLSEPVGQLVIVAAVLAVLVAVAVYIAGKLRAETRGKGPSASEMLSKFRESHSQGDLSDEEFREIKVSLADRLESELRDTGETG